MSIQESFSPTFLYTLVLLALLRRRGRLGGAAPLRLQLLFVVLGVLPVGK